MPRAAYVENKRTTTVGRRQPRDRGWSTFGRSQFMLPKMMSGHFLVSNESALCKLHCNANFIQIG